MDLLSVLTQLVGQKKAQPNIGVNPYMLPNKNQLQLGQSYKPFAAGSEITNVNVDKPAALPRFSGTSSMLYGPDNLYHSDITSTDPYMFARPGTPSLPDHQYQPGQKKPVQTTPAFLRALTQAHQQRT